MSFVGLVNFYHRFISKCVHILKPLNYLLSSTSKNLEWTPTANELFHLIKDTLANISLLSSLISSPTSDNQSNSLQPKLAEHSTDVPSVPSSKPPTTTINPVLTVTTTCSGRRVHGLNV